MTLDQVVLSERFAERHLPLEACFNFRDIGGYEGIEGRAVRRGRYYRSGALHRMTPADFEQVCRLEIASVVDLRRPDEIEEPLGPLVEQAAARHHHVPVIPDGGSELLDERYGRGISGARYVGYLEFGGEGYARALELLADGSTYPTVIHCSAGKDRTGTLTAIVLDLLGVDRDTIVADYALTNLEVERLLAWLVATGRVEEDRLREGADDGELRRNLGVPVEAIEHFLAHLDREYGGAEGYARSIGVGPRTVERIRSLLLE